MLASRFKIWFTNILLLSLLFCACKSHKAQLEYPITNDYFLIDDLIKQNKLELANTFIDSLQVKSKTIGKNELQIFRAFVCIKSEQECSQFESLLSEDKTLLAQLVAVDFYTSKQEFQKSFMILEDLCLQYKEHINNLNLLGLKLIELKLNYLHASQVNEKNRIEFANSLDFNLQTEDSDYEKVQKLNILIAKSLGYIANAKEYFSIVCLHYALNIIRKENLGFYKSAEAAILAQLADRTYVAGVDQAGQFYYEKAISTILNNDLSKAELCRIYTSYGYTLISRDSVGLGLGLLQKSIDSIEHNNPIYKAYSNQIIAQYYIVDRADVEKGQFYLRKALNYLADKDECFILKRKIYNDLSFSFYDLQQLDSARYFNNKAFASEWCNDLNAGVKEFVSFYEAKGNILQRYCEDSPDFDYCEQAITVYNERDSFVLANFAENDLMHYTDFVSANTSSILSCFWEIYKTNKVESVAYEMTNSIHHAQARILKSVSEASNSPALGQELKDIDKEKLDDLETKINGLLREIEEFDDFHDYDSDLYRKLYELYLADEKAKEKMGVKVYKSRPIKDLAPLNEIKASLQENNNQVLLYHSTPEEYWLAYLNQDTVIINTLPKLKIDGLISKLNEDLYKKDELAKEDLILVLHQLYKILVEPYLSESGPNITIIPDGLISGVPFEALIENETNSYKESKFLLMDYIISYDFDLNQILTKKSNKFELSNSCIISYTDYETQKDRTPRDYAELDSVYEACLNINDLMQGGNTSLITGKKAVADELLEHLNSDILLLALHGKSESNKRFEHFLVFRKKTMEADSFYTYELLKEESSTKLLVLVACETAIGQYRPGAGTFSISQDFLSIGVETVVKTMWKIKDFESKIILQNFFEYMQENTLSQSLRLAKVKYISESEEDLLHPYFWAGFTLEGNPYTRFAFPYN